MISRVYVNFLKSVNNTGNVEMKEKLDKQPEDIL